MLRNLSRRSPDADTSIRTVFPISQDTDISVKGTAALLNIMAASDEHLKQLIVKSLLPDHGDGYALSSVVRRAVVSVFAAEEGEIHYR